MILRSVQVIRNRNRLSNFHLTIRNRDQNVYCYNKLAMHYRFDTLQNSNIYSSPRYPRRWRNTSCSPISESNLPPKAFAIGTLAGVMGSLMGMGGGFVMIPLMTSQLALTQHVAHGTSLFAVAATGMAGALSYGLSDAVELDSAAAIAVCGMVTARFGAASTVRLCQRTLKKSLGVFMLFVAPVVPAKAYFAASYKDKKEDIKSGNEQVYMKKMISAGIIGLGSGFMAGMFGVGGGAVVVPALTVATDMNYHSALGTSLCAMILPAMSGTFAHYQKGHVAIRIAPALALGSFFGAYVGGKIGIYVPEEKLRYGFTGLMLTLGTRTILKA